VLWMILAHFFSGSVSCLCRWRCDSSPMTWCRPRAP
jgi:hypothetical protein